MSDGDTRGEARALLTEITADVLAWAEWARETGARSVPWDESPPLTFERPSPTSVQRPVNAPSPSSVVPSTPPPVTRRRQRRQEGGPESLDDIRQDLGNCQRCELHQGRTHIVFGVGSARADLVVVGEAPGFHEDRSGEPFVGRAGQLLTRMLAAIGVSREQAYICNVLKCRPPDNRDPRPQEISTCSPFMARQLKALQPRVILTAGRFAANTLLSQDLAMGRLRGQVHDWQGIPVVPTYHPAYLLRTPEAKARTWEDLLLVRGLLEG
ncbi:MAG: uracil-DNA glycosylase [Myxococcota bacterium]|nr:uracil-DNA glycosylase [Myxococcota bacterium]